MTRAPLITRIVAAGRADPDAVAVVAADATLSYRDLLAAVRATAAALLDAGIGLEQPVGVATRRDSDFVVSALAVLAAGGCFVPLDVTLPPGRLSVLVARAGIRLALAGAGTTELDGVVDRVLPPAAGSIVGAPAAGPEPLGGEDALAYQLFTSGSTGEPKVVAVEQRSVCALVDGIDEVAAPRRRVVASATCPFSFDVSVWELFAPLLAGGTVHVLDDAIAADPERLVRTLLDRGITTAYLPPYGLDLVARVIEDAGGADALDRVLVGVEPIPQRTLQRLADAVPGLAIVNGYGPTETTVCATLHRFVAATDPDRRTPIGTAVPGWVVRTVDQDFADAEAGEIVVGGAGLARGYVGDADPDRFVVVDGQRWYRTGDLGRWLPSGVLEFLGRADDQVKVGGFRIELGEVETALLGVQGVDQAVVCAPSGAGGRRLLGFVVGDPASPDLEGAQVRRALTGVLPDYAVPSRVVVVDRFPLTANGKIDRAALVAAASNPAPAPAARTPATGPGVTAVLAGLWCEVLDVAQVDPEDNFFDLGGDSRSLAALTERVRRVSGRPVRVIDLMAHPTVAQLAAFLEQGDGREAVGAQARRRAAVRDRRRR